MPLKLTGGSFTVSIAVLAAAWTIRSLRDRRRRSSSPSAPPADACSRYFAQLSLEATALLIHLSAVPYCFIDVRAAENAAAAPLAAWVAPAVNIPEAQLQTALKQPAVSSSYAAASANTGATQHNDTPPPPQHPDDSTAASTDFGSTQQQQQQQQQLPLLTRHHLLVLVSDSQEQQQLAASRAAAAGFDRVAVPSCGIEQLLALNLAHNSSSSSSSSRDQQVLAAAAAAAVQFPAIHADALAVLLGLVQLPEGVWQLMSHQGLLNPHPAAGHTPGHTRSNSGGSVLAAAVAATGEGDTTAAAAAARQQRLLLLDVRRHDERTLYGAIPGAHHIPVDELASALALPPGPFRQQYHFEPPVLGVDVLVLHSRAASRAQWGAQICLDAGAKYFGSKAASRAQWGAQVCLDAGAKDVFVYPEGVMGWPFGPGVDAYPPYQQGDKPPEPEPAASAASAICEPDVAAGVMELQQLGLVGLLASQQQQQQQQQ